jgi:hypothetical protein
LLSCSFAERRLATLVGDKAFRQRKMGHESRSFPTLEELIGSHKFHYSDSFAKKISVRSLANLAAPLFDKDPSLPG